ncbi:hypothetical protein SCRM01_021 [Synechococcus phage S-CRM01]|uniref:hypothetical protein n=1 Tax=Synechococcus phage S-CRM01 TaxID=1026955 RepID=UPI000209E33F|nr:hypothetical protein SCRM01_021 [Synechococcus phage S-CRM01]AEC52968.1 hypothetical protein SCRM01_021 [Synechococcus phage S-CRM01]
MALRNAFGNLTTEGISLRLNQIAGNLAPLGLAFDPSTGLLRCTVISGTVAVSTLPTLGTVTTVTTLSNQTNIGNISASSMVIDSMNTAWASNVRSRIN